ncbi:unnamed protein product, partial [Phaeothamnion confervicola]
QASAAYPARSCSQLQRRARVLKGFAKQNSATQKIAMPTITVVGCASCLLYHRCIALLNTVAASDPSVATRAVCLLESSWEDFVLSKGRANGGNRYQERRN